MRSLRNLPFWKNASSRRKRIYSFIFLFVIATLTMVIGSLVPLSTQDADQLSQEFNQTIGQNITNPIFIFRNNFTITLIMFIPILGFLFGLYTLFLTGLVGGAILVSQGYPSYFSLLLLTTPIFWLEFTTYSIAMAESIWLFRRLLQASRPGWRPLMKRELKWLCIFIAICAGLLAAGAVVEVFIIKIAGG